MCVSRSVILLLQSRSNGDSRNRSRLHRIQFGRRPVPSSHVIFPHHSRIGRIRLQHRQPRIADLVLCCFNCVSRAPDYRACRVLRCGHHDRIRTCHLAAGLRRVRPACAQELFPLPDERRRRLCDPERRQLLGPRIVAAITHSAPPELVKAPVSSFGWIQADLRKPLPPIEELHEHPIGFRDGRRVVLCTESYLIASRKMFETIEVSKDFTEHYEESERVYVCTL